MWTTILYQVLPICLAIGLGLTAHLYEKDKLKKKVKQKLRERRDD